LIHIWLERKEDKNVLHVYDNGTGIDKRDLSRIFKKFYSKTPHGMGIGLAYCKATMKALGGSIHCCSKKGEFAELILYFPCV
jgi:signal transduction histidine kinase